MLTVGVMTRVCCHYTCLSTEDSRCFKYKCSSFSLEFESFWTGQIWCPIDIKNRKV